jgi:hypothetical protein
VIAAALITNFKLVGVNSRLCVDAFIILLYFFLLVSPWLEQGENIPTFHSFKSSLVLAIFFLLLLLHAVEIKGEMHMNERHKLGQSWKIAFGKWSMGEDIPVGNEECKNH